MSDDFKLGHDDLSTDLDNLGVMLADVVDITTGAVIAGSADKGAMTIAYAALSGRVSGDRGRRAFRQALEADGVDPATIDRLDAHFTRCLLDPHLPRN